MKSLKFIIITVLLIATSSSVRGAPHKGQSLKVIKHLKNSSYAENQRVKISCVVENATSYLWYKNGNSLKSSPSLRIHGKKLVIKDFNQDYAGLYECKGIDNKSNFGKTSALLSLRDDDDEDTTLDLPCVRQEEPRTTCFPFDESKCPNITSFAPLAKDLRLKIIETNRLFGVSLSVKWNVPRQGRDNIWGWQIRIFGHDNIPGYQFPCSQFNKRYNSKETIEEEYHFPVFYGGTYEVEVQGIPNFREPHDETVVRQTIDVGGYCSFNSLSACCGLYVNTSLGLSNNTRTLFWTTNYPANLNVTINGFKITWSGNSNIRSCFSKSVTLGPLSSNYTFRELKPICESYTVRLLVLFVYNSTGQICRHSRPVWLYDVSPTLPPAPVVTPNTTRRPGDDKATITTATQVSTTPESQSSSRTTTATQLPNRATSNALATAGFTVAAIFGGIVIVALIYFWKKHKVCNSVEEAFGMQNGKIQDSQIRASSFSEDLLPHQGRLHSATCWKAAENDSKQWIQVDLNREKSVSAIATQGRKNAKEWVTSYVLWYSVDGDNFKPYQVDTVNEPQVFSGNTDRNTVVTNDLSPPIVARYVRIQPQAWYDHISMRFEIYGSTSHQDSKDNVKVFILNSNHCNLCVDVVHTFGALLMGTGRIHCDIDVFATMHDKCEGLRRWTQAMISKSDHVIIPLICEITPPKENNTVAQKNALFFNYCLEIIHEELVGNPNRKDKFIPVCLDNCSFDTGPAMQALLQTYSIPSKIDDLVVELLGETRRKPNTRWPILEFDDDDYKFGKTKLTHALTKLMKKNQQPRLKKKANEPQKANEMKLLMNPCE